MTVGELRAALEGVRDEARLLAEVNETFGAQFEVVQVFAVGGATDDPGLVLKLRRTR